MLKLMKAVSLTLCYATCFCVKSEELTEKKWEEYGTESVSEVFQSLDEVNEQTLESCSSGTAAVGRIRKAGSRGLVTPECLMALSMTFSAISHQIETAPDPDNIDIILLLDANGKMQTLALMYFLSELENTLQTYARRFFPDVDLKLFSVIDSFVGEGGGAIPASICALGNMTIADAINIVQEIPNTMLCPKSFYDCCGCCIGLTNFAKAAISAYTDNPQLIDENDSAWVSLYYDTFKTGRAYNACFQKLYGLSSLSDLISSFETLSFRKHSSISGIVSETVFERDEEAKAHVKRLGVTEVLSTAETVITGFNDIKKGDEEQNEKLANVARILGSMKINLNKSSNNKDVSINSLREHIMQKTDIPRDMLIISLISDTCEQPVIIPTFKYSIKTCQNGKKIINLNYKIAIPKYLYTTEKEEESAHHEFVRNIVKHMFPTTENETNISRATDILINLLNNCNLRALQDA